MAGRITVRKLGPDDAGMRLTAEELASADFRKRIEYHAIGVKEHVIVDRFKHVVLVLTWQPGDHTERALRPGDTYTSPILPGLQVPIHDAFGQ